MSNNLTIVSVDTQEIINTMITAVEAETGETLYPGDERRIFIENLAPVIAGIYGKINDTAQQSLLRFARGDFLDAMGEMTGTTRLPAEYASCTVQFTAASGHPDITVPAGTRVSPDGKLYFTTTAAASLPAGTNTAQVGALALVAGNAYNGLTPGQVAMIIDPMPWLEAVANTMTTAGGADIEEDGSTELPYTGYRARIREAVASFSTAGAIDSYAYWASTASQNIKSVKPTRPSAGEILISVLMDDGSPSADVLAAVLAACSDRTRRPLGDHVTVQGPGWVDFTVNVSYTINSGYATSVSAIREAVEGAGGAIEQYIAWQTAALGRAVTPSQLIRYMYGAGDFDADTRTLLVQGINSVTITTPTAAAVLDTQAARLSGSPAITYGGVV